MIHAEPGERRFEQGMTPTFGRSRDRLLRILNDPPLIYAAVSGDEPAKIETVRLLRQIQIKISAAYLQCPQRLSGRIEHLYGIMTGIGDGDPELAATGVGSHFQGRNGMELLKPSKNTHTGIGRNGQEVGHSNTNRTATSC